MNTENKEYEVEELVLLYERLIDNLEQLSMDANSQIERLKGFVVTDEIASDISDIANLYILILFENNWISQKQMQMFENIDENLKQMSMKKELWSESALIESPEWEKCRSLGKELLNSLERD